MLDIAAIVKKASLQVFAAEPAYEKPVGSDAAIVAALSTAPGSAASLLDELGEALGGAATFTKEQVQELLKLLGDNDSWFSRFRKEATASGLLGGHYFDVEKYRIRHRQFSGVGKMAAAGESPEVRALKEVQDNLAEATDLVEEISRKYEEGKEALSDSPEDARFLNGFQHLYEDFLLDPDRGVVPVLEKLLKDAGTAAVGDAPAATESQQDPRVEAIRKVVEETVPEVGKAFDDAAELMGDDADQLHAILKDVLVKPWEKVLDLASDAGLHDQGQFDIVRFRKYVQAHGDLTLKEAAGGLRNVLRRVAPGFTEKYGFEGYKNRIKGLWDSFQKGMKELAGQPEQKALVSVAHDIFCGKSPSLLAAVQEAVKLAVDKKKNFKAAPSVQELDAEPLGKELVAELGELRGDKLRVLDKLHASNHSYYKSLYQMYSKKLADHNFDGNRRRDVTEDAGSYARKMDKARGESLVRWKKILDTVKPDLDALDRSEAGVADEAGQQALSTYRTDPRKWGAILDNLDYCMTSPRWDAYLGRAKEGIAEALKMTKDPAQYAMRKNEQQEAEDRLTGKADPGTAKRVKSSNPYEMQLDRLHQRLVTLQKNVSSVIQRKGTLYSLRDKDTKAANSALLGKWYARRLAVHLLLDKMRIFKRARNAEDLAKLLSDDGIKEEDFKTTLAMLEKNFNPRTSQGADTFTDQAAAEEYGKQIDAELDNVMPGPDYSVPFYGKPLPEYTKARTEALSEKDLEALEKKQAEMDSSEKEWAGEDAAEAAAQQPAAEAPPAAEELPEVPLASPIKKEYDRLSEEVGKTLDSFESNKMLPESTRKQGDALLADLVAELSEMGFGEDGSFDASRFDAALAKGALRTAALALQRARRRVLAETQVPLRERLSNQMKALQRALDAKVLDASAAQKAWDTLSEKVSAWKDALVKLSSKIAPDAAEPAAEEVPATPATEVAVKESPAAEAPPETPPEPVPAAREEALPPVAVDRAPEAPPSPEVVPEVAPEVTPEVVPEASPEVATEVAPEVAPPAAEDEHPAPAEESVSRAVKHKDDAGSFSAEHAQGMVSEVSDKLKAWWSAQTKKTSYMGGLVNEVQDRLAAAAQGGQEGEAARALGDIEGAVLSLFKAGKPNVYDRANKLQNLVENLHQLSAPLEAPQEDSATREASLRMAVRLAFDTLEASGSGDGYTVALRSDSTGGTYKARSEAKGFPYTAQEFFADYDKPAHLRTPNFKPAYASVWEAAKKALIGNLLAGTVVSGKALAPAEREGKAFQFAVGRIVKDILGSKSEMLPREHFHRTLKLLGPSGDLVPGLYPASGKAPIPMPSGPVNIPFYNPPKPAKPAAPKAPGIQTDLFGEK